MLQYNITLIFIHDMFQLYSAIIRCPHYAKMFAALLVSILKLKLKLCSEHLSITRTPDDVRIQPKHVVNKD
jgi:hypothetical protein